MKDVEVRGVPMRVYEAAPPSMRFVWELATGYGDRDYVVFEDERYTYAETDAIIRALSHHLRVPLTSTRYMAQETTQPTSTSTDWHQYYMTIRHWHHFQTSNIQYDYLASNRSARSSGVDPRNCFYHCIYMEENSVL